MSSVIVSSKFQLVIPVKVREIMHIKPGQKMHVIAYDNTITFIPVQPIKEARGSLRSLNTKIGREEQDRP